MSIYNQTNTEIAQLLAKKMKAWRVSPRGAGLTQEAAGRRAGIGLTPLKRFEKTGATTLANFIAYLRALDLLEALETMIPDPASPSPLELLAEDIKLREMRARKRAPRTRKKAE